MTMVACGRCGAPTLGELCGACHISAALGPSGADLIAAERRRQVTVEGWSEDHDDQHTGGELAFAAMAYMDPDDETNVPLWWPWDMADFKPSPGDRIRELVKAGALIAAEIDRLGRRDG